MNIKRLLLLSLLISVLLFTYNCKQNSSYEPIGELISHSDCLNSTTSDNNAVFSDDNESAYEIIKYKYVDKTLYITHMNSCFNCCPGDIVSVISVENENIIIMEDEKKAQCSCLCLYNINYAIHNLEKKDYTLIISSKYIPENDNKLICHINLIEEPTGIIKFKRNTYPWI